MDPNLEILQYGTALLLLVLAGVLTNALLTLSHLISPHNPTKEKQLSYECGEDPVGSAWLRFNIRFYVVALVFVLFDVEMALIYPVAVIFKGLTQQTDWHPAMIVFGEMFFFIAVLFLGLIYIWRKGDLGWIRTYRKPTDVGLRSWHNISAAPIAPSEKADVV
jgi:NADH-quinone oxidoreductase subunit A